MATNSLSAVFGAGPAKSARTLGELPPPAGATPQSPAEAAKAQAEAAAARQQGELAKVREKGIYAYAQEKKFEALRDKIEKDLKAAQGLDDKTLSAMSPENRAATTTALEAEIADRVRQAMEENLTQQARTSAKAGGPALAMIIDISI